MPIEHDEFMSHVRVLLRVPTLDAEPSRGDHASPVTEGRQRPRVLVRRSQDEAAAPEARSRATSGAARWTRLGIQIGAIVVALAAGIVGVGTVGWGGVRDLAAAGEDLYSDEVVSLAELSALHDQFNSAHEAALTLIITNDPGLQSRIAQRIHEVLGPAIERGIDRVRDNRSTDGDGVSPAQADALAQGWRSAVEFTRSPGLFLTGESETSQGDDALAAEARQRFEALDDLISGLVKTARDDAAEQNARFATVDQQARTRIITAALVAILVGVVLALRVGGGLVSRTRSYSRFAVQVASRSSTGRLEPKGSDELTELGHALNAMVDERTDAQAAQLRQDEYTAALQVVADESESYNLLRRHIERVVPQSTVVVLRRNNSADRLEACTPLAGGSAIEQRLEGATPASCLAIRSGRPHHESLDSDLLTTCDLCRGVSGATTCEPLLVAGEVIGSVLASSPKVLEGPAADVLHDAIVKAAPVIANLRNLAVAQQRATVDLLTGLATRRALQEALPRYAAQAARHAQPLAAAIFDLDRFKTVNDTYGHDIGDQIIAATGEAIRSSVRASDFAARYGGEEFVVLFPATRADGAAVAVTKIRQAIAAVHIPGGPPVVSASVGIAVLPDDTPDTDGLLRTADRALYIAKQEGRDRICIAAELQVAARVEAQEPR